MFLQTFYFISDLALTFISHAAFPRAGLYFLIQPLFLRRPIRSINTSDAFFVTNWERCKMSSCQKSSTGRAVSHWKGSLTPGESKWQRLQAQWVARERHKGGLGSITEHPLLELQLKSHFHLYTLFKIPLILWNKIASSMSQSPWLHLRDWGVKIQACPALVGNNFSKFPKKLCLSSCLLYSFSIY